MASVGIEEGFQLSEKSAAPTEYKNLKDAVVKLVFLGANAGVCLRGRHPKASQFVVYNSVGGGRIEVWDPLQRNRNQFNRKPEACIPLSNIKAIYVGKLGNDASKMHFTIVTMQFEFEFESASELGRNIWCQSLQSILVDLQIDVPVYVKPEESKLFDFSTMPKEVADMILAVSVPAILVCFSLFFFPAVERS